jgi:esterase/lipase superfamily enzyme
MQPGDELWVVNTRRLGCPSSCRDFRPQVSQYLATGWTERSVHDLVEAPPLHTVVYVHGNRFDHADAIQKGFRIYRLLARGEVRPTMRFVIWSWPSERVPGPYRDVRLKAERADVEGYYLACLIAKLTEETPWSFLGHSFGARVIGGALEAMGSGELWGVELEEDRTQQPALVRVALLAAAIDGDVFLPGRDFSNALAVVERLLVLYNPTDPVLKRYALLDRYRRPRALGAVGMPRVDSRGGVLSDIRQQNVARIVGRSHDDERFYSSPALMGEVRRVLLEFPVVESP